MTSADRLAAALRYAAAGWPVLPCRTGGKAPEVRHGCYDATTDEKLIRHWWGRWRPNANIGIRTGAVSGLVVIDLDCKNEVDGFANWAQLMTDLGIEYAPTRCIITPTGGLHLYFAHPGGDTTIGQRPLGSGIDVRADGGFVVAPPSTTPTGVYELDVDVPPVPLPAPLFELLTRPALKGTAGGMPSTVVESIDDSDPYAELCRALDTVDVNGNRDGYVRAAVAGEVQRVMDTVPGERNRTLNRAAFALGQLVGAGLLDEHEVYRALMAAADAVGLVADDGENQCQATIASGLRAGKAQPRTAT